MFWLLGESLIRQVGICGCFFCVSLALLVLCVSDTFGAEKPVCVLGSNCPVSVSAEGQNHELH